MSQFTADEKAKEAKREVGYRRRVYARLVNDHAMSAEDAMRRVAIMEEICDDYLKIAAAEAAATAPELDL